MKQINVRNGKIFIDAIEAQDAYEIGKAVLENKSEYELAFKEFTSDTRKMLSMIELSSEYHQVWNWINEQRKDGNLPCIPRVELPFSPNFHQTQLLADLFMAIKSGVFVLDKQ